MDVRRLAIWLMVLPLVCQALAWLAHDSGLAFTVVMAVLLIPAMRYWQTAEIAPTTDEARTGGWWAFAAIAAVALPFRLVALDRVPFILDHDAGLNAGIAAEVMAVGHYVPFAPNTGIGTETAFFYAIAGLFEVFGHSVWTLRLAAVIGGMVGLWAMFLFAREVFGRQVALVATLLCAVSPYTVLMHRTPKHSILVPPVLFLTYYLLLRGTRTGRLWMYALAGVAMGAGMQTYAAYRHGIVVALVVVAYLRPPKRAVAAIAAGIALAVAPMVPHLLHRAGDWIDPMEQNSRLGELTHDAIGLMLHLCANAAEVVFTALLLRPGEAIGIQTWVGVLTLGALPLLCRRSDPRLLLLGWISAALILAPIGARFDHAAPRRYVGLMPMIFILPAIVLLHVRHALEGQMRQAWTAWAGAMTVVLAVIAVLHTAHQRGPEEEATHRTAVLRAAHDYVTAHPDAHAYVPDGYALHGHFALSFFLLHPRVHELRNDDPFNLPTGQRAVLFPAHTPTGERLARSVPEGVVRRLEFEGTTAWTIDPAAWQALQGDDGTLAHNDGLANGYGCGLHPGPGNPRWRLDRTRIDPAFRAAPLSARKLQLKHQATYEVPHDLPHDVAIDGETVYIASLEHIHRYTLRNGALTRDPSWSLRDADQLVADRWNYRILPEKPWSIETRPGELVVSNRAGRWVARFAPDGTLRNQIGTSWNDPIDVALHPDGRVAVADLGQGHIAIHAPDNRLLRTIKTPRPVAIAWLGNRLAILDESSKLLRVDHSGTSPPPRFIGRIDLSSRLCSTEGTLIHTRRGHIQSYDDTLRPIVLQLAHHPLASPHTAATWQENGLYLLNELAKLSHWTPPTR